MRPKFILTILFITLVFLLVLIVSPGFWRRKSVDKTVSAWVQNPTPETEDAVRLEQNRVRRYHYVVCSLAVLNVIGIIVYGGLQQKKRLA